MSEISRSALFGKLNSLAYKAIESATVFCKLRGNPYVELVHWIHQILQLQDSDVHQVVKQFNIDPSRLAKDLMESLDRLPRGSTTITGLSSHVEQAVERGWVFGTLMFGEARVRTGHLVVGAVKTPTLRNALLAISREFDKIKPDTLTDRFAEIVAPSPEEALKATEGGGVRGGATTDGLDFDWPNPDPTPTASLFSVLSHQSDRIEWSAGSVPSVGVMTLTFAIDVPDSLAAFNPDEVNRFRLRQTPIVATHSVPEPSPLLLLGAGLLALVSWRRRV